MTSPRPCTFIGNCITAFTRHALYAALMAMLVCFVFAASSKADTTSAGGVSYTFTSSGTDASGVSDVTLTIDTTGAVASQNLSSFSVQFTGATSVTVESSSAGTWNVLGKGTNTGQSCNINKHADHWCADTTGGGINVMAGGSGVFTFVFDVDMGNLPLPSETHIQAFQGGPLAISNDVGIGSGSVVPEPATLALLGLSILGVSFRFRRK